MQVARLSKTPVLRRMRQPSIAPLPFGPALQRRQPLVRGWRTGAARMTTDRGQIRRTGSSNNPSRSSRVLLNSHSRPAGQQSRRATARPPILYLFSERSVVCVAGFLHRRFAYPRQNDLIEAPNRTNRGAQSKFGTYSAEIPRSIRPACRSKTMISDQEFGLS